MRQTNLRVFQGLHNIAGAPSVISEALKRNGFHSESICFGSGHANYAVDTELKNDGPSQRKKQGELLLKRALKEFDVFHFHYGESILGAKLEDVPLLKKKGKTVFFHFHGCDIRNSKVMFEVEHAPCRACWPMGCSANRKTALATAQKYADGIFVSTPDLLRFLPEADLFLQPFDPEHLKRLTKLSAWIDLPENGEPFKIMHAPSNRVMKGTYHVIEAVEKLKDKHNVELDLVEGVANAEAVRRFEDAHIIIDQMYTGCYGTVSVEAMAVGRPVLCNIGDAYKKYYPSDLPIIPVTSSNLYQKLDAMLSYPEGLNIMGQASRNYVLKHHHIDRSIDQLTSKYTQFSKH